MKKRYQIDQQRAVPQFRRIATEQNPNIQMILPMADIVGLLQDGVAALPQICRLLKSRPGPFLARVPQSGHVAVQLNQDGDSRRHTDAEK